MKKISRYDDIIKKLPLIGYITPEQTEVLDKQMEIVRKDYIIKSVKSEQSAKNVIFR